MKWSKTDNNYLLENFKNLSYKELGKNLNRTENSVSNQLWRLGIQKNNKIFIGEKFRNLTVIDILSEKDASGLNICVCQCECGNFIQSGRPSRLSGSCGCDRKLKPTMASWNYQYQVYQSNAKRRNLIFEITIDQFKDITKNNCHYCNRHPKDFNKYVHHTVRPNLVEGNWIQLNGIDRKNNLLGYIKSNCLPCCAQCNWAKADMTYDEYKKWINDLLNNRDNLNGNI